MFKRFICLLLSSIILVSSFVVPVFATDELNNPQLSASPPTNIESLLGIFTLKIDKSTLAAYSIATANVLRAEYNYGVITRFHNNAISSGYKKNYSYQLYAFKEPVDLTLSESQTYDLKITDYYVLNFALKEDGTFKFQYLGHYIDHPTSIVCFDIEKTKISTKFSFDTDYSGYLSKNIFLQSNYKLSIAYDNMFPDDVEPDTDSLFDDFPILDFSECTNPIDYVITFFKWLYDVFVWFINAIKGMFSVFLNVKRILENIVVSIFNKFIENIKHISTLLFDSFLESVKLIFDNAKSVGTVFLKKIFVPSDEFLSSKIKQIEEVLISRIGDYRIILNQIKDYFYSFDSGGSQYMFSAPVITHEYKGIPLTIDFSFLNPYMKNIRVFIGSVLCIAQTWWLIRHLPSLIGKVSPFVNHRSQTTADSTTNTDLTTKTDLSSKNLPSGWHYGHGARTTHIHNPKK